MNEGTVSFKARSLLRYKKVCLSREPKTRAACGLLCHTFKMVYVGRKNVMYKENMCVSICAALGLMEQPPHFAPRATSLCQCCTDQVTSRVSPSTTASHLFTLPLVDLYWPSSFRDILFRRKCGSRKAPFSWWNTSMNVNYSVRLTELRVGVGATKAHYRCTFSHLP